MVWAYIVKSIRVSGLFIVKRTIFLLNTINKNLADVIIGVCNRSKTGAFPLLTEILPHCLYFWRPIHYFAIRIKPKFQLISFCGKSNTNGMIAGNVIERIRILIFADSIPFRSPSTINSSISYRNRLGTYGVVWAIWNRMFGRWNCSVPTGVRCDWKSLRENRISRLSISLSLLMGPRETESYLSSYVVKVKL